MQIKERFSDIMKIIDDNILNNIQIKQDCRKILDKTVSNVVEYLKAHHLKIASAESCSGGLISSAITSVPGASAVFDVGLCTYSAEMKIKLLGIDPEIIKKYGVVSYETAAAMAEGLARLSGADICVSTTGIAGPLGALDNDPVGTVYSGFYYNFHTYAIRLPLYKYNLKKRDEIRENAVLCVLCTAYSILNEGGIV